MSSHSLTLGHFKEQLRKKGNYRWVQRPPGERGGRRPSGSCCRLESPGSGENHKARREQLTRLGRSEQTAAGKSARLNVARATSISAVGACWEGRRRESGWEEEFELQRFGSHLLLISMLRHT